MAENAEKREKRAKAGDPPRAEAPGGEGAQGPRGLGMKGRHSLRGRKGLPWHDHAWLRGELERLGTVTAVARTHGINPHTLYSYMSRHKIRAPHRPSEFGRPLKDPANPSPTTLWRRKRKADTPAAKAPAKAKARGPRRRHRQEVGRR